VVTVLGDEIVPEGVDQVGALLEIQRADGEHGQRREGRRRRGRGG
jgi:hypothetical protein